MFHAAEIRACIADAAITQVGLSPETARDVAFHLTDWLNDLDNFASFCEKPRDFSPEQVNGLLLAFLLHAPNHLAAAARLYTGTPVEDIFEVGAVAERPSAGGKT